MDANQVLEPVSLSPGAEYGNLAFDQFVLVGDYRGKPSALTNAKPQAHWDISQREERDQKQWNHLASKWLSMSHVERSVGDLARKKTSQSANHHHHQPFWNLANDLDSSRPNAPDLPTQPKIQRTLGPHQTITEPSVSQLFLSRVQYPVWIRTCYSAELSAVYEEIFEAGQTDFGPEIVLNDENLYAHSDADWTKVFLRLPALADTVPYHDPKHPENDDISQPISSPSDEEMTPLYEAVGKAKSVHYLVDEEALRARMVKIHFLDIHGRSVWWNWIRAEHIWIWEALAGGGTLARHIETCVDDRELLRPGTVLNLEK